MAELISSQLKTWTLAAKRGYADKDTYLDRAAVVCEAREFRLRTKL